MHTHTHCFLSPNHDMHVSVCVLCILRVCPHPRCALYMGFPFWQAPRPSALASSDSSRQRSCGHTLQRLPHTPNGRRLGGLACLGGGSSCSDVFLKGGSVFGVDHISADDGWFAARCTKHREALGGGRAGGSDEKLGLERFFGLLHSPRMVTPPARKQAQAHTTLHTHTPHSTRHTPTHSTEEHLFQVAEMGCCPDTPTYRVPLVPQNCCRLLPVQHLQWCCRFANVMEQNC